MCRKFFTFSELEEKVRDANGTFPTQPIQGLILTTFCGAKTFISQDSSLSWTDYRAKILDLLSDDRSKTHA